MSTTTEIETLFSPVKIGNWELKNRIAMAPMTRSRASSDGVPADIAALYYSQRASAGLIITEGTGPSAAGMGYPRTPGMYTDAQENAWRPVTRAVHEAGGKIVLQLMHVGRIAHSANRTIPDVCVAPSAIRAAGQMWTDSLGMQPLDPPRALELREIAGIVAEYGEATRRALSAGFDGVELHAASGYLPMQFLSSGTNRRTDEYGGSVGNRIRFVLEALRAMTSVAGPGRVGIKISPQMQFNDVTDDNPLETYSALAEALNDSPLAYVHLMRVPGFEFAGNLRSLYRGGVLLGGGFDLEQAAEAVNSGGADVVVFGSKYVSNPDLVRRLREGLPLTAPDPSTFYSPGPEGYVDYASL